LFEVVEHIRERFEEETSGRALAAYVHDICCLLFGFECSWPLCGGPLQLARTQRAAPADCSAIFGPTSSIPANAQHLYHTSEEVEHVAQQLGPLSILEQRSQRSHRGKETPSVLVVLAIRLTQTLGRQNRNKFISACDDYKRGPEGKKIIWMTTSSNSCAGRIGASLKRPGHRRFITNNFYLDALTHRRSARACWNPSTRLRLNLHGSSRKETAPDGTKGRQVSTHRRRGHPAAGEIGRRTASREEEKHATVTTPTCGLRKRQYDWLNVLTPQDHLDDFCADGLISTSSRGMRNTNGSGRKAGAYAYFPISTTASRQTVTSCSSISNERRWRGG